MQNFAFNCFIALTDHFYNIDGASKINYRYFQCIQMFSHILLFREINLKRDKKKYILVKNTQNWIYTSLHDNFLVSTEYSLW